MPKNRSPQWLLLTALIWSQFPAFHVSGQTTNPPATSVAELRQRLQQHLSDPRFEAADWGIKIVSLDTGKTLFENRADKLFQPASNSKLYTCALALDQFGNDHRIRTSLYAGKKPNRWGVLYSDLIVFGRGDPTINSKRNDGDIFKALDPLADQLVEAGVKRIRGDLVGDDSYLPGPPYGASWSWDDMQYYYGAELSALTINDNILALKVTPGEEIGDHCTLRLTPATDYVKLINRTTTATNDAHRSITLYRPLGGNITYVEGQLPLGGDPYDDDVTVHNPAGLFVALFKEALKRRGIPVTGKTRTIGWLDRKTDPVDLDAMIELGALESPPMSELVREVQKPSQNLYTDLLLAYAGVNSEWNEPGRDAESAGVRALYSFLNKAGIEPAEVRFDEGSGLSRNNLTTPAATVKLLQFMHQHPCSNAYLESLPVAGVDGTLRRRMKETPAEGNVRAKTGTLRWANSLSGRVTTAAGEHLVFSVMLNRYYNTDPQRTARSDIDAIAVMLAEFKGHSSEL